MSNPNTIDLGAAKQAHENLQALYRQRRELQERKQALEQAISATLASGDLDNGQVVAQLNQDKATLELFPAKLAQVESAIASAVSELRDDIMNAVLELQLAAAQVRAQAAERLSAFLGREISEQYKVEELVQAAVPKYDCVIQAESLATLCGPNAVRTASASGLGIILGNLENFWARLQR